MMKLYKFKVTVTSQNRYEREIVAANEDEAIDIFISSIDDNDKISEEQFDVEDIENVGDDDGYTE
jgi:ribosomal protein L20A (L18A)